MTPRTRWSGTLPAFALLVTLLGCATAPERVPPGPQPDQQPPHAAPAEEGADAPGAPGPDRVALGERFEEAIPGFAVLTDRQDNPAALVAAPFGPPDTPPTPIALLASEREVIVAWALSEAFPSAVERIVLGDQLQVAAIKPIIEAGVAVGLVLETSSLGEESRVFIFATTGAPRILRTPLSSRNATRLADPNGDGLLEFIRATRVFQPDGTQELLVEAFAPTDEGFERLATVALLREANARLLRLKRELETRDDAPFLRRAQRALAPVDGAPTTATLLPTREALVPTIGELGIPLGADRWQLAHEIAIRDESEEQLHLYRITLDVNANPFADQPVRVAGLDNGE